MKAEAFETDYNRGGAARHALAGPQVKRNTRPAPVVDPQVDCRVRFNRGNRIDTRFLPIPGNFLPPTIPSP